MRFFLATPFINPLRSFKRKGLLIVIQGFIFNHHLSTYHCRANTCTTFYHEETSIHKGRESKLGGSIANFKRGYLGGRSESGNQKTLLHLDSRVINSGVFLSWNSLGLIHSFHHLLFKRKIKVVDFRVISQPCSPHIILVAPFYWTMKSVYWQVIFLYYDDWSLL